jgi:hypothetical protein
MKQKAPEREYYVVEYGIRREPWQESRRFNTEKEAREFYVATLIAPDNHSNHVMKLRRVAETILVDGYFDYATSKAVKDI